MNEDLDKRDFCFLDEPEDTSCKYCKGYGELPGDPHTGFFPVCPDCEGTGIDPRYKVLFN